MHFRRLSIAAALSASLILTGCTANGNDGASGGDNVSADKTPKLAMDGHEVIPDANGTGIDASAKFFEASDNVVVAGPDREHQMRGAALAVDLGAPLLVRHPGTEEAIEAEIARLGADNVVEVPTDTSTTGDKDTSTTGDKDTSTTGDESTYPNAEGQPQGDVAAIAALEPQQPLDLVMPTVFATWETSRAAAATARAAGADVEVLEVADPRVTSTSISAVTSGDVLALGQQWGSDENLRARAELAGNGELPGGGGLVFPGRRMIALYGHPYGPDLGVMGEQDAHAAAELAKEYASWYQPFEEAPVIPAFEVIATVASGGPGDDGNYSNETPIDHLVPYVDAILDAGGYAVLDLQPGQASFLEQAKLYEDLLKRPNVGLALDAEWKLNPGEQPLSRIGSATSAEINEVADWLAALVRENNLPQKMLILHQFQLAMYPDRENIVTGQPELAWVLHADGHGVPGQKFDTWNVLREGLDPNFFMAWKNFIDEDTPTFSPEQTYADVNPRPWFVSYQ
ncbi:hypothetical protein [Corynebacterium riegelii]|uniref:Cell wall-binding repeat 2 family protein n=1 Tax=Corynebacterium riegelii TaxID=156976 RepID=A0A0K1RAU4_9CORY|nr:hypothetical protein [Corynebacterium riegelii]AKV58518.1 hypothetical protein AK829_04285 [Corynebacterium riegelii]